MGEPINVGAMYSELPWVCNGRLACAQVMPLICYEDIVNSPWRPRRSGQRTHREGGGGSHVTVGPSRCRTSGVDQPLGGGPTVVPSGAPLLHSFPQLIAAPDQFIVPWKDCKMLSINFFHFRKLDRRQDMELKCNTTGTVLHQAPLHEQIQPP